MFLVLSPEHPSELHLTNRLGRANREIGQRAAVVAIFPNHASALRLTGALLVERNDQWLVCQRYLPEESVGVILDAKVEPVHHVP